MTYFQTCLTARMVNSPALNLCNVCARRSPVTRSSRFFILLLLRYAWFLNRLPIKHKCDKKRTTGSSHTDVVCVPEAQHICRKYPFHSFWTPDPFQHLSNLRCATVQNNCRVNSWSIPQHVGHQPVLKDSLRHGNEYRSPECLEELDTCRGLRDQFLR